MAERGFSVRKMAALAAQLQDLRCRSAALRGRAPSAGRHAAAGLPAQRPQAACCGMRGPKHVYGGPEPFGTGPGILRVSAVGGRGL